MAKKKKVQKKLSAREIARRKISTFNKELRVALSIALLGAFGFLMALVWRDLITSYLNEISEISPFQGRLFSALIVTIVSVLGILLVTKFISIKENKK